MMEMNLYSDYLKSIQPWEYPRLFLGPPGIGKTAKTRQIMQNLGYKVVPLNMGIMQRIDFIGVPKPVLVDNEIVAGLGGYYDNLPPKYIYDAMIESVNTPICIIFDEVTRMSQENQSGILQIIDSRRYGDVKLPPDTVLIFLANPSSYAGTYRLTEALEGRLSKVNLVPNVHDWTLWASQFGIDNGIISFLQLYPDSLYEEGIVSPRKWHKLSERISKKEVPWSISEEVISEIGEELGLKFLAFLKGVNSMVDPFKIISGDEEFPKNNLTLQYFTATDITRVLINDPDLFPQFCKQSLNWPAEIVKAVLLPNLEISNVINNAPDIKDYEYDFNLWCRKFS